MTKNYTFSALWRKNVLIKTKLNFIEIPLYVKFSDPEEKLIFKRHLSLEIKRIQMYDALEYFENVSVVAGYLFLNGAPWYKRKLENYIERFVKGIRNNLTNYSVVKNALEKKTQLRVFLKKTLKRYLRNNHPSFRKFERIKKRLKRRRRRKVNFLRRRMRLRPSCLKKQLRIAAKFKRRDQKRSSKERLQQNKEQLKNRNFPKVIVGTLTLKPTRRNFFIVLSKTIKKKIKIKFKKRKIIKTYNNVLAQKSIGHLRLYKGRAKSSGVAKKALAKLAIKDVIKNHCRILHINCISEMRRAYTPALAGLAEKNVMIKSVKRYILRPHGYVRKKKKRRT